MVKAKANKTSQRVKDRKRRDLLDFARDNNLVIHPGKGYDYYVDSYFMFDACPCDTSRKQCPCPESVRECEEQGHCLCKLFWKDHETFKKVFVGEEE